MSRRSLVVGAVAALLLALLLRSSILRPIPFDIEPVGWQPPAAPSREGPLAPNSLLDGVIPLRPSNSDQEAAFVAPETIVHNKEDGWFYFPDDQGYVLRMDPRTNQTERWLYVGGRPLGLTFSPDAKQLFLADPIQGLVSVDVGSKSIRILTNIAAGSPIRYADDVDVSKTGDQIYFSDASKYPPLLRSHNKAELAGYYDVLATFLVDYFAGVGSGRLLRYTLSTGLTEELVSGIAFCNGVALSRDESFVVFAETSRYRLHRYWLKGPKVGQSEVFVDNLPSMPDGVSLRADGSGHFWVAIPAVSGRADADLVNPYPSIKALLLRMLHLVAPSPPKDTMILEVDEDGNIVRSLASDKLFGITAITEYQPGKLLLGSLTVSSFLPTLLLPQ